MKFDIEKYRNGRFVMHCKTEAEARDFCNYLHSMGRRWSNGRSYLEEIHYNSYGSNTCYNFKIGQFCRIHWYTERNYNILEWSDFMNESPIKSANPFKKTDLKTGDIALHRNGTVSICIHEFGVLINSFKATSYELKYLNDNLTDKNASYLDIVAVRRPTKTSECQFCAFEYGYGTLVYERE